MALLTFLLVASWVAANGAGPEDSSFPALLPESAHASNPCTLPIVNPIVCENSKPGTPSSVWLVSGSGDRSIEGFTTDISVNQGATVSFKILTSAKAYTIDIYRLGYYGGLGGRLIASIPPSVPLPQSQPPCVSDPVTFLYDCGTWRQSASWAVPADATSGVYFAKLTRTDTRGANFIPFIIRSDVSTADLLYQTSDTTWQAYNYYGGRSLYPGKGIQGTKVSYNRPIERAQDGVLAEDYPTIRFLEANGYNVSYAAGLDSDRLGGLIRNHRVFLSVGHDEYWSAGQFANVKAARDAGTNLAFLSGNEIKWKTRWEPSIDGANTPNRTLVCYKESAVGHPTDPLDPPIWTGTWVDNRFSPPADGGRPGNLLSGTLPMVGRGTDVALKIPAADGKMRYWRNTAVATQAPGQTFTITAGCNCVVGGEWDADVDNGFRPPGLFHLSTTVSPVTSMIIDPYGVKHGPGIATHTMTMYRAPSGALVFSAGAINWALALEKTFAITTPDPNLQQATVNLFADMGVQPGSLQSGLTAATQSTDVMAPTSTMTNPANGATIQLNSKTVIAGTAVDTGGGVLGGVEVSVDGGATWHPAAGREQWTYTWTPTVRGPAVLRSRAVDDSGNLEHPGAGITVTVK